MLRMKSLLFGVMLVAAVSSAHAQTLQEALVAAYENNPELQAQRAQLRAVDEGVAVAQSGYRPSVDAVADVGAAYGKIADGGAFAKSDNLSPRSVGITLTQPVFSGFRTSSAVDAAQAEVMAARATLHGAEQKLLLEAAKTYLDVVQAQKVLALTQNNEHVLSEQLTATERRFEVGEVTKTDIAQAQARLNAAISQRIRAEGDLTVARASYTRVIGGQPETLEQPALHLDDPKTLDAAIAQALADHPLLSLARYGEDSARARVEEAKGALLPDVALVASAWRGWDQSAMVPNRQDSAAVMARMTVPLYRSGADYARTRAAHQTATQKRLELEDARQKVREQVITAWQELHTAKSSIKADEAAVGASELALHGVQEESKVGTRTVLDTLNAQQELLSARVNLVRARHDEALAILRVKASVGALTPQELRLPVKLYDPKVHYDKVRGKWFGTEE
jgi:TolC family type I secretion outer membrane protein